MATGNVTQIKLPNGDTYDIVDSIARLATLTATYTANTQDLELEFNTAGSADNEEY